MFMPAFAVGTVMSHNAPGGGYVVQFRNAQGFGGSASQIAVSMGYDYASPLTISQRPLPPIGSWVVVAFPNNSDRNAIHFKSYNWNQQDAITTQASDASGAHIDYEGFWSGAWRMVDGQGQSFFQWPDGSYFGSSIASGLPTLYRNIVTSGNVRTQIPFPMSARVATQPAPFWKTLTAGPSGSPTSISIDPSGNVSVSGSSTARLTFNINGTSITVASGNVTVALQGGDQFIVNSTADALVLVSKLVEIFNAHTHKNSGGSGTGGTVTTAIAASDVQSAVVAVSS